MQAIFNFLFNPQGRISRKQFWLQYFLPYLGISITSGVIDAVITPELAAAGGGIFGTIVGLFYLWPSIAVPVKRFHDRGMTGWYVLIFAVTIIVGAVIAAIGGFAMDGEGLGLAMLVIGGLIAAIAAIVQLVILGFLPGQQGPNQYGQDPLDPHGGTAETFA